MSPDRLKLNWKILSGLLMATLLLGLPACGNSRADNGQEEADASSDQPVEQTDELSDAEITEAVNDELSVARGVSAAEIAVETNQGVVTLSGIVDNVLAQERAARIASMVRGVRSVVNTLTVEPSERTDTEITTGVLAALAADPATEEWELTATTDNGIVTLSGTVDSWQEQRLAARVAKGVSGVQGLENDIEVDYDSVRSDSEIREEVQRALQWDARLNAWLIDVGVNEGVVTLAGNVGSAYEKTEAISDAYVAGVQSVEADDLTVDPGLSNNSEARTDRLAEIADSDIQEAINDALLYDPRVAAFKIGVTVNNGIATLSGVVDNLKAKRAAAQDAANTVGVWQVNNNILVQLAEPPTSSEIIDNVEAALQRDPFVEASEVQVAADEGTVTLTGVVDSYFEKWQAGDAASRAIGVVALENNLLVDYDLVDDDVVIYDWDPTVTDYDYIITTAKSDDAILDDIRDGLYWSPYVDREAINVSVEDGIATLTGSVDTWYERNEASEEALEGGAIAVINELKVSYGPDSSGSSDSVSEDAL